MISITIMYSHGVKDKISCFRHYFYIGLPPVERLPQHFAVAMCTLIYCVVAMQNENSLRTKRDTICNTLNEEN